MQRKTEVLTVRVTPEFKRVLKKAAERERRSQANFLEHVVLLYSENSPTTKSGRSVNSGGRTASLRSTGEWNSRWPSCRRIRCSLVALIVILGLLFVVFFLIPAIRLSRKLSGLIKALGREDLKGPVELGAVFEGKGVLQHLWSEYRETLHDEKVLNPQTGQLEVVRIRATQPSDTFFTEATVVDTPVRSEFFKHLPGILTGIGIIGTFSGLIYRAAAL